MSGIIVIAYQPALHLEGWSRFVLLAISSLFLIALTLEVIKKGMYMTVVTEKLKILQEQGLKLNASNEFYPDPTAVQELSKDA
jgi:hypothetical protein